MWTIVYFVDITSISVSKQGILFIFEAVYKLFWSAYTNKIHFYVYVICLPFEAAFKYKYFDPPTHQKIHLYVYIFFYYVKFYTIFAFYTFLRTPKKMLRMFWNAYTFQNICIWEKNCIFFYLKSIERYHD